MKLPEIRQFGPIACRVLRNTRRDDADGAADKFRIAAKPSLQAVAVHDEGDRLPASVWTVEQRSQARVARQKGRNNLLRCPPIVNASPQTGTALCNLDSHGKGTVYNYFRTKEDLVVSFMVEVERQAQYEAAKLAQGNRSPQSILTRFIEYQFKLKQPHYPFVRVFLAQLAARPSPTPSGFARRVKPSTLP